MNSCTLPTIPRATKNECPFCIKCRRKMYSHGERGFICVPCHQCAARYTVHQSREVISRLLGPKPPCPRCHSDAIYRRARGWFYCIPCNKHFSKSTRPKPKVQRKRPPTTGEGLLMFALSVLPKNLPPDIREEAQAEIVCDLLSKKVSAGALLDPARVRRYITTAYGMSGNRFRFRSLDAPMRHDSPQTFGEMLIG